MHKQQAAEPLNSGTSRYTIRTTDVLQDLRVNVCEEASPDKVIWYKERFLGENEIIEQVVHNQTSRVCWMIHRPLRGWYIRLRAPTFPPGAFIPLTPLPKQSPYYADASLSFASRTNPTPAQEIKESTPSQRSLTLQDDSSRTSVHSYPPTPTASTLHLPVPSIRTPDNSTQSQVTQFILAPSAIPSAPQSSTSQLSFFSRALSALRTHHTSYSNSFMLSRVPLNTPLSPPPPYALSLPGEASQSTASISQSPPSPLALHPPLLTFHDHTSLLTVGSLTGHLEISKSEEVLLGVDTSFWITIALAYLEFLEERESYLAAATD